MKKFLVLVGLAVNFFLIACDGGSSALVGNWLSEPKYLTQMGGLNIIEKPEIGYMELLKDGTGIVDGVGISWKVQNNRFYVIHSLRAASWEYTVSGETLTLTNDKGTSLTMNKGRKRNPQFVVGDPSSPYIGKRPLYSYYTGIGSITTKTRDSGSGYSVTVVMNIGYDQEDIDTSSEIISRQDEIRNFVRSYFTGKYASELSPENEARFKQDIKEILNTRFLEKGKVRIIVFDKLDVMESF